MDGDTLTLNELARAYLARSNLPLSGRGRVLGRIALCRTPVLGGRTLRCNACGHREVVWKSCLNRHCPSCMGGTAKAWVERLEATLLPVPYFHLVFTLPRPLADLALYNKEEVYGLLMRVSAEVLKTIAADKKFLGGKAGFISVLHTWSQTLEHHPHVHMVVPGGVITPDGAWRSSQENFFVPVRVLSALFRRRFLEELQRLRDANTLRFQGRVAHLRCDEAWADLVRSLRSSPWVVYAKRPFGGPTRVLKYLARYTHRVAISNRRLLAFDGERVTFGIRPSEATNHRTEMQLTLHAFIQRFLLHVLPRGFVRIRYYGFLHHNRRADNIALVRAHLGAQAPTPRLPTIDPLPCPACGHGTLERTKQPEHIHKLQIATTGPPPTIGSAHQLLRAA